jgi:hypothetical protein
MTTSGATSDLHREPVSAGEPIRDLARLLREMRPRMHEGTFAFCLLPDGARLPSSAIFMFREREGITALVPTGEARALGLTVVEEASWITLEVNSSLEAVGLTSAVARVLTDAGIPCNMVAALHHDHLFVPVERGADALAALRRLTGAE